jgi:hypothetical protein
MPKLPANHATLDPVDKQIAKSNTRLAKVAKACEVATSAPNTQAYKALFMPSFLQDLFTRYGEALEEGITPLRACPIQLAEVWNDVGFKGAGPFNLKEDIHKHNQEF